MQLIFTFSFFEIFRFFSITKIFIKMSEILNFWLAPMSDVHTCAKVYTACQFGAFFTKCTMFYMSAILQH